MLIHDVSIVICPNLGGMIVDRIAAYPEELDRHMMFKHNEHGCSDSTAGNGEAMRRGNAGVCGSLGNVDSATCRI